MNRKSCASSASTIVQNNHSRSFPFWDIFSISSSAIKSASDLEGIPHENTAGQSVHCVRYHSFALYKPMHPARHV
jgi:hypothetical protein